MTSQADMASGAVDAAERITATVGGNPSDAAERSLDDLVKVVVEAAGAANRSAGAAADSTENLLRAAGDLGSLQARARRNALLMLGTVLAVSLLTLGCMVWMAMSLARSMSDLEQLGALYAKRVSDLKSEVRELRELPPLLREVADKVAQSGPPPSAPPVNLAPMTAQIRESIEQSSRQQDGRSKQLSEQVQRLQSAVETQARQLAQLRELAERGRGEARMLDEINRSLALLAAEKARPTEARPPASTPRSIVTPGESRTAATKDRDFVRYPVVPPDSK